MDEPLFDRLFRASIFSSSKSHKTIMIDIDLQRIHRSHKNINSKIILVSIQKMRLVDILACHLSGRFGHSLLFMNHPDSSSTSVIVRLENIKRFLRLILSIELEFLVIFWKDVTWRNDLIFLPKLSDHL